MFKRLIT